MATHKKTNLRVENAPALPRTDVSHSGFALEVHTSVPPNGVLGVFDLEGGETNGWDLALTWLGGDFKREVWTGAGSVREYSQGECRVRAGNGLVMFAISLPDDGRVDPAPLAEQAYRQVLSALKDAGNMAMVRLWNFLPHINRGAGDNERYKRFCVGRSTALDAARIGNESLCAGTAIGNRDDHLRIYGLAAAIPGVPIENPRQTSAYYYPPQYGPRSPSFARATALPRPDGSIALLISGTASVVGHATLHPADLHAQLTETIHNLNALLETSCRRLGHGALAGFDSRSLIRVYLRNPATWDGVLNVLRKAWPEARITGLSGDICRRDLEMEIEAWHCG